MRHVLASCLFISTLGLLPASAQSNREQSDARPVQQASAPAASWRVLRTAWTDQDERAFEEFIERIGESDCRTTRASQTRGSRVTSMNHSASERFPTLLGASVS